MELPSEQQLKEFDRWKVARPSHTEHGVVDTWENPLSEQLIKANPHNWKQAGNILSCDTDFGPLSQRIPTHSILVGEKDGLPLFRKVVL